MLTMTLLLVAVPTPQGPEFHPPVRLAVGREPIRLDSPGYASPCWFDVDSDGKGDLVVGQFDGGKMRFYKNRGAGKLGAGVWIEADGNTAEVPGVW